MNFNKMMKECTKSHPLLHSVSGVGLGMVAVSLLGLSPSTALVLGLLLLVGGVAGEFVFLKK